MFSKTQANRNQPGILHCNMRATYLQLINVHLKKNNISKPFGQVSKYWSHYAAWAAPRGSKVNHNLKGVKHHETPSQHPQMNTSDIRFHTKMDGKLTSLLNIFQENNNPFLSEYILKQISEMNERECGNYPPPLIGFTHTQSLLT